SSAQSAVELVVIPRGRAACVFLPYRSVISKSGSAQLLGSGRAWIADEPPDITAQCFQWAGTDARDAVQFELHEERRGCLRAGGGEAVRHHPDRPAVSVVLDARQGLEQAFVLQ